MTSSYYSKFSQKEAAILLFSLLKRMAGNPFFHFPFFFCRGQGLALNFTPQFISKLPSKMIFHLVITWQNLLKRCPKKCCHWKNTRTVFFLIFVFFFFLPWQGGDQTIFLNICPIWFDFDLTYSFTHVYIQMI